jgi:hypothetical protein
LLVVMVSWGDLKEVDMMNVNVLTSRTLALMLLASVVTEGYALEAAAKSSNVQVNQMGLSALDMKMEGYNSILLTTINKILACNNKKMIFASDASVPDRDADGCVPLALGEEWKIKVQQKEYIPPAGTDFVRTTRGGDNCS